MARKRVSPRAHVDASSHARRRPARARAGDSADQPDSNQEVNVGRALRSLRSARDLSSRALAEKSGLSVNTLSLIENSKTSPSVATLQQLAIALEVPITAFFESGEPKSRVAFVKARQRRRAAFAHGTLEDLGVGLTERTVEPFVVTIEPSAGSGAQSIVHTGHEFVFCLEGRITYTVHDQTYLLEPGDSLLFESHLAHRWHNVDAKPAKMLLILYPADVRDRPAQHHFAPEVGQGR